MGSPTIVIATAKLRACETSISLLPIKYLVDVVGQSLGEAPGKAAGRYGWWEANHRQSSLSLLVGKAGSASCKVCCQDACTSTYIAMSGDLHCLA